MKLWTVFLGCIDYQEAFELQKHVLALRQANVLDDVLLILEHPPVLTLGMRNNRSNILISEEHLKKQGISVHHVNRGGDVTYHGPGQIVMYPIIHLNQHGKDIHRYVRNLEETIIQLLSNEYGIAAQRDTKNPGVWIGNDKIAAVGTAVKRWVTMHGLAFNVNTRLADFSCITPCGIQGKGVTSLEKLLGARQDLAQVQQQVMDYFCQVFELQGAIMDKRDLYNFIKEQTSHE